MRSWGHGDHIQRRPAAALSRFVVPLTPHGDSRSVPNLIGFQTTLYAEPALRVVLGPPAYDRKLRLWDGLACTSLQIARNELFACQGWIRMHDALCLARGAVVEPGMVIQMRVLNFGAGGFAIPPIGWYAVAP